MRRCLLLLGFMAHLGLVLLLRETIVAFQGNMLTVGFALAAWLLTAALGFLLAAGRKGEAATSDSVAVTMAVYGVMLPVSLLTARLACLFLRTESESLIGAVLPVCVAVALPHGCLTGILAALLVRIDAGYAGDAWGIARRAIGYAALGALAAAAVLALPEKSLASPLQVTLAAAAICALTAFVLWRNSGLHALPWGWALLPLVAGTALMAVTPVGEVLDFLTRTPSASGGVLRASSDTASGRVQQVQFRDATWTTLNGRLAARVGPEADWGRNQTLAAIFTHPAPRRLLVIGTARGAVKAALELPWLRVDWVGGDEEVFAAFQSELLRQRLDVSDQRLEILYDENAQAVLNRSARIYDVILVADSPLGAPNAARCGTMQFFRAARNAFTDAGGVVAYISQSVPQSRLADEVGYAVMVRRAIQAVFPSVAAIRTPAELCLLATPTRLAGFPNMPAWQERMNRWRAAPVGFASAMRGFVEAAELTRSDAALASMGWRGAAEELHSAQYLRDFLRWRHSGRQSPALGRISRITFWDMLLLIVLASGLVGLWLALHRSPARPCMALAQLGDGAIAGFWFLALILAQQSLCGAAYGWMGWLLAGTALGLAGGAVAAGWSKQRDMRLAQAVQTAFAVAIAVQAPALLATARFGGAVALSLLSALAALPVGAMLAVSLDIRQRSKAPETTSATLARRAAARALIGAGFGAAAGALLAPVIGLVSLSLALAVASVAGLPLLLLSHRRP